MISFKCMYCKEDKDVVKVVETLLAGRWDDPLADTPRRLLTTALALLTGPLFLRLAPWRGVLLMSLAPVALGALGYLLLPALWLSGPRKHDLHKTFRVKRPAGSVAPIY